MSPPFFPFGRGQLPNKRQYLTERVRQRFSPFRPCLCSAEEMIVMTQILVVVCVMNINLPSPWTIPLFELKSGNNLLGTPLLPYLASLILETHLEHRSEFILWMRMVIHLFIQLFFFWNSGKKRDRQLTTKKGDSLLKVRNRSSATTMSFFFVWVLVCADIRTNPSILWPSSVPNCFKVTSRGFINRIIYWPASKCRVRRRRYFHARGRNMR